MNTRTQTQTPSPRFSHLLTVALLAATATLSSACSELIDELDGVTDDCTVGEVTSCMCPDGTVGAQVCLEDGESYGACACGSSAVASDDPVVDDGTTDDAFSHDDGTTELGDGPDAIGDVPTTDGGSTDGASDPAPTPEPLPDPDVELRSARMRVYIIGGSMTAAIEADWSVTGRDDVVVDIEVLSSVTYRAWTTIAAGLPPVYFTEVSLPVTQGERRFDVRVVARDGQGHRWVSNTITIE